jgi:Flp pilus assembly protein TadG
MERALRKQKMRFNRAYRDKNGAALVEFAVIAVPFLGLIFGMLEVGLIFWTGYELDHATLTASRLIKTGQAQKGNYTKANMITQICSRVVLLSNCTSELQLKVQSFSSFDCAAHPARAGCTPASDYNLGGGSQIELVTSSYEWPLFNFATVGLLSNLPNGNRLIQSAAVFQNEPF